MTLFWAPPPPPPCRGKFAPEIYHIYLMKCSLHAFRSVQSTNILTPQTTSMEGDKFKSTNK